MLGQRTVRNSISSVGIGVHSGKKVEVSFTPAPVNSGITFIRNDIPGRPRVHASADNVSSTMLTTSLTENGVTVSCVEHLMAALWSLGIDNLFVEMSGEEVPIMDGSAAPFIYLLKNAGVHEQSRDKQFIKIKKSIVLDEGDTSVRLNPYSGFKASYTFLYDHPVYNRFPRQVSLDFAATCFEEEVSRARTFGLTKDLDNAQSVNKCMGSSLENSVAIDDFNIRNKGGLRYQDEFAKHKLLDALGDLYLLGHGIIGEFVGYKSGHTLNNQLARTLLAKPACWELVSLKPRQQRTVPFLQPVGAIGAY